jgi:single-strand DNA-binding protein
MMNQITIAGHLGADPEVRFTSSGQKVTTLRVAARVRRNSKGEDTIWWRVTIWGEQFDKMIPYLKKGSPIIVFGELSKPEIFTDRDGRPQVSMNITANNLLFSPFGRPDGQGGDSEREPEMAHAAAGAPQKEQGRGKVEESFKDDEIPF